MKKATLPIGRHNTALVNVYRQVRFIFQSSMCKPEKLKKSDRHNHITSIKCFNIKQVSIKK